MEKNKPLSFILLKKLCFAFEYIFHYVSPAYDFYYTKKYQAPVAQLDRALPSEGRGHRFKSCRVHQSFQ